MNSHDRWCSVLGLKSPTQERSKFAKGGPGKGVPSKPYNKESARAHKVARKERHRAILDQRRAAIQAAREEEIRQRAAIPSNGGTGRTRSISSSESEGNISHESADSDTSIRAVDGSVASSDSDSDATIELDKKGGRVGRRR